MNAYPSFRPWELDHYSRGELKEMLGQLTQFLPLKLPEEPNG